MLILVDHGAGNLRSVYKAFSAVGADIELTADPDKIKRANKVVLPGVGAFGDVMNEIRKRDLEDVLLEVARRGTPLLGICVGMQVLFETGEELGQHAGLGLLPGAVRLFPQHSGKIPQTGWNQIQPEGIVSPLLAGLDAGAYAYFNHSFYCDPNDKGDILAYTDYGLPYASVVRRDNLFGVQFHPEKSQHVGLTILKNFTEMQ